MASEPAAQQPGQPLEAGIEFQGRTIRVRMPEPEQIVVWRRTLKRIQDSDVHQMSGQEIMAALERVRVIIDSVMLDPADIDWLDDEMMAGRVKLVDAAKIVADAMMAFNNRAERRAAKTAAGVRRKKA